MKTVPITHSLVAPGRFWTFNREERNAVAVLVGLLTRPGNMDAFTSLLDWRPPDLDDAEVSVEWTFLRDLWSHHSRLTDVVVLRTAILDCLQPVDRDRLAAASILEFNTHFGAVPKPSPTYIQSPSNWSLTRFNDAITGNDEFRRTCRFKWAFNIKPDLVIQTPSGHVLCVEAKWDSAEGSYPATEVEKAIFRRRGLGYLSQTEVQQYLVTDVLGFTGTYAYLARTHITTTLSTDARPARGRCRRTLDTPRACATVAHRASRPETTAASRRGSQGSQGGDSAARDPKRRVAVAPMRRSERIGFEVAVVIRSARSVRSPHDSRGDSVLVDAALSERAALPGRADFLLAPILDEPRSV